ncbi:uncharacterized protein [Clytia hemisphaerica]
MHKDTTKLQFCGPLNYPNPILCQSPAPPIPLNKFTKIKIQQIPNGDDSKFIVYINGKTVWTATPNYPTMFSNVKVYEGDPYFPAANIETKNYKFQSGITAGHVLETVKKLQNMWTLKLAIIPVKTQNGDTSILHATPYFDSRTVGELKIDFLDKTTRLRICVPSLSTSYTPYCITFPRSLPLSKLAKIQIRRRPAVSGTDYIIHLNGEQKYKFNDPTPNKVDDVNMYLSDPFMAPANAVLEAYQFNNGVQKGHVIDEKSSLGPAWKLNLKITITNTQHTGWINILHAVNNGVSSDLLFYVFIQPRTTRPYICTALKQGGANLCTSTSSLSLNRPTLIEIDHFQSSGKYYYQMTVGGQAVYLDTSKRRPKPILNANPRTFENVVVYASSPYYNKPSDNVEISGYSLVQNVDRF